MSGVRAQLNCGWIAGSVFHEMTVKLISRLQSAPNSAGSEEFASRLAHIVFCRFPLITEGLKSFPCPLSLCVGVLTNWQLNSQYQWSKIWRRNWVCQGEAMREQECMLMTKVTISWPSNFHWHWTIFATFYSFFQLKGIILPGQEYQEVKFIEGYLQGFLPQVVGELVGIDSGEQIVFISFQLCVQWGHIHGLKSVTLVVCIPAKLANMANWDFSLSENWLLNIYQHSTPYKPHLTHQCVMQIP